VWAVALVAADLLKEKFEDQLRTRVQPSKAKAFEEEEGETCP